MARERAGLAARMPRALVALACVGAGVVSTGCTPARMLGIHPERPAGPLTVTLSVPAHALEEAAEQVLPARVRVSLVKDAHLLVQERPVGGGTEGGEATFSFTFDRVYDGRWEVAGELVDAEGDVTYAGSARLYVAAGQAASVQLRLGARPATLRVRVDLTGYDRQGQVTAAGVRLSAQSTTYLRDSRPPGALAWEFDRERAPGTYDVQVLLYGQDGSVEFSSERVTVALLPGKRTAVSWAPAAGGPVTVTASVDWIPGPPAGVACTPLPASRELEVAWQPPADADLAAYRVYLRPPDGFLHLEQELPATALRTRLDGSELPWEEGGAAHAAVGAVDLAGQQGLLAEAECRLDL